MEPTAASEPMPEPVPPAAISEPEVRRKVVAAVAQALDLDPSEVTPEASLEEELGAESLDFLDLAFILEREFQVRLPRLNLLQRAEERYGEGSLIQDGLVTGRGLALLAERMPEVRPERLRAGLRVSELGRLVTAETFVRVVMELLAHKAGMLASPCPSCGGPLEASAVAPELACARCGAAVPLPAGDEVLV